MEGVELEDARGDVEEGRTSLSLSLTRRSKLSVGGRKRRSSASKKNDQDRPVPLPEASARHPSAALSARLDTPTDDADIPASRTSGIAPIVEMGHSNENTTDVLPRECLMRDITPIIEIGHSDENTTATMILEQNTQYGRLFDDEGNEFIDDEESDDASLQKFLLIRSGSATVRIDRNMSVGAISIPHVDRLHEVSEEATADGTEDPMQEDLIDMQQPAVVPGQAIMDGEVDTAIEMQVTESVRVTELPLSKERQPSARQQQPAIEMQITELVRITESPSSKEQPSEETRKCQFDDERLVALVETDNETSDDQRPLLPEMYEVTQDESYDAPNPFTSVITHRIDKWSSRKSKTVEPQISLADSSSQRRGNGRCNETEGRKKKPVRE